MIWLCITHDDQGQHGTTVEDPRGEAEEVYQGVDSSIAHHRARNYALEVEHRIQKGNGQVVIPDRVTSHVPLN